MGEWTKGLLKAIFQNAPIVPLIASKYTWAQLYADIALTVGWFEASHTFYNKAMHKKHTQEKKALL